MATLDSSAAFGKLDQREYRRRIRAWTMYDWANSAFATTILAAVLPVYYSTVAGANLPSEAIATAYWSLGLSASLLLVAILSPILGTMSDVMRGKKVFLSIFAGLGIVATALMVLVSTGDFMLASVLAVLGRVGFNGSITFYDALLPHVAREEDQDRVSTLGFALGYLGGGLLLAINIAMIQLLPGTWGARLSFLSVAIWWAVFTIPVLTRVPEPPAAPVALGESVVKASFRRLGETLRDIRQYKELFKLLIAFIIYNDGIGTIIGVAAIYGAELGFGTLELILALLLVQFVGIPFSLIFGRLPDKSARRRPFFLAFVLFNTVMLPVMGIVGLRVLPPEVSGAPLPLYETTAAHAGDGTWLVTEGRFETGGAWAEETIRGEDLVVGGLVGFLNDPFGGVPEDAVYLTTGEAGAYLEIPYNGQQVEVIYSGGPEHGQWTAEIDGQAVVDEDSGEPLRVDAFNPAPRYGITQTLMADEPGEHVLRLINAGQADDNSEGTMLGVASATVLPPIRQNNLGMIIGLVLATEVVGLLFALAAGKLFTRLVEKLDTKRSIILALCVYAVIAIWGFFLDSTVEFWFLAWMVAIVQGGSQALSRSLYASMSPAAKSGEFFGLFAIMEKFASLLGPLLFAAAAFTFGSSRPAILGLIAFFIIGIVLLLFVNPEEGRRLAQEEDARLLGMP
jgi:UMF1 family MFS transporter